jgi:hypothetical protein
MTEQCRHSCCDPSPLVRNRRRSAGDKWLSDMKYGHQVRFFAGVYEKTGIRSDDILRVDIGLLQKRRDFLLAP